MNTGMIYNFFVCFVTGFVSLTVFFYLRKVNKKKNKESIKLISYFSMLFSFVWILTGLGVFFVWIGRLEWDEFLFKWFTSPLIYAHLIPAIYYFGWSFFENKRKIRIIFNGFLTFMVLLAILTFFQYGFTRSEITYWGSTLVPNGATNNIFTFGIFIPIAVCIIVELFRRFKNWKKTGDYNERQMFGFNLGLFIYAITGFFDALSSAQGWLMLLARIGSMLPSLVFYLFATSGE